MSRTVSPGSSPSRETGQDLALGRRESGGGLVEDEQARVSGEAHGQLELTVLPVRQGSRGAVSPPREPHPGEELDGRSAPRGAPVARAAQAPRASEGSHECELDIPLGGQTGKGPGPLVGPAQPARDPPAPALVGDVDPEQRNRSVVGPEVPCDQVDQGGLPGSVGAEQGAPRARREVEIHLVDRDHPAEAAGHPR